MIVQRGQKLTKALYFYSGTTLVIEASGTVKDTIAQGAYVHIEVKYGYIKLVNLESDLCEQLGNVDLACPIEPGKLVITKSVDLPKQIPPVRIPVTLSGVWIKVANNRYRASTPSRPTSTTSMTSTSPA